MAGRYRRLKEAGLCPRCGKVPPEEGFAACRPCRGWFKMYRSGSGTYAERHARWNREWSRRNPDKKARTDKKLRDKWKVETIAHYGGACVCCGEINLKFLTLDHIYGKGKTHRKDYGGSYFYCKMRTLGYPEGVVQVMCFNCNLGRAINGGICPHAEEQSANREGEGVIEVTGRGVGKPDVGVSFEVC